MNKANQAVMQAHREDLEQEREDRRAEYAEDRRPRLLQPTKNTLFALDCHTNH